MEDPNASSNKKQRRSFGGGRTSIARRSISGGGGTGKSSLLSKSSAVSGFGGFATAWEVKDTLAAQEAAAARQQQQQQKENLDTQKPPTGANAADIEDGKPRAAATNGNNPTNNVNAEEDPPSLDAYGHPIPSPTSSQYAALPLSQAISLTLTLRGTQFHRDDVGDNSAFYKLLKKGSQELVLEREPDNEYDNMAIRVGYYCSVEEGKGAKKKAEEKVDCNDESSEDGNKVPEEDVDGNAEGKTDADDAMADDANNNNHNNAQRKLQTIGHIAKEQAKILSPYLDAGCLRLDTVVVSGRDSGNKSWYKLRVGGMAKDVESMLAQLDKPLFSNVVDVDSFLAKGLGKIDLEESKSAHYHIDDLPPPMPWSPLPQYENSAHDPDAQYGWPWEPYDPDVAGRVLPAADVADAQAAQWPPLDDVFKRLGMGPKDDAEWWSNVAGLKPPIEWNMAGAHDVMGKLSTYSRTTTNAATEILDGAIHGVTSVWTDDMLDSMREAMHSKDFWCYRGQDAFIRSFGGPYVLGQKAGKLKLIQGVPHTDLTAKICRGHNLVYAATHLKHPLGPGFNVIVFGLNIRRGGFHFHKDHISGLSPKAAPLLDEQPVATTVFYERPDLDDGKEVVNWKPANNWTNIQAKKGTTDTADIGEGERGTRNNNYYLAPRTVRTYHGMIHIQRAGLQKNALHGIFHAPGDDDERKGYRVAITARVAHPDAEQRIAPFIEKEAYACTIGPEGKDQLPSSTA